MRKFPPLLLTLLAAPAWAGETRQLDSHEHGVGELNIAIDGLSMAMEFHAPGADIVGFEYRAESAQDRAAVDAALATLSQPLDLFVVPTAADCSLVNANAALESESENGEHEEHGHDEEHDHDKEHEEGHEEEHRDEHAKEHHDEEGHSEHGDENAPGHTEFHAEYSLTCNNPSALSSITFAYFDAFENARELQVQVVSASGAAAFQVDAGRVRHRDHKA